jgi:thioredoxin 1
MIMQQHRQRLGASVFLFLALTYGVSLCQAFLSTAAPLCCPEVGGDHYYRQGWSSLANKSRRKSCLQARSNAPEVTDDTWEEMVLKSKLPVLCFFSAAWCGPCRLMCEVLNEVMEACGDRLRVVEVSTDDNPECVALSQVRSIPTLMLFVDGASVMTVVGAIPKNSLINSLSKHVELLPS